MDKPPKSYLSCLERDRLMVPFEAAQTVGKTGKAGDPAGSPVHIPNRENQLTPCSRTSSQVAVSVLHFLMKAVSRLASPVSLKEMAPVTPV